MSTTSDTVHESSVRPDAARASGLVARSRLFQKLDSAARGPITLVSAPPGSGKTTLLRSWLATRTTNDIAAWVDIRLDESDEAHFWGEVLDALRAAGAVPPDSTLATLLPSAQAEHDELLGHLLAGLRRLDQPLLLVLDDVHHLRSAGALAGLETLLAQAP